MVILFRTLGKVEAYQEELETKVKYHIQRIGEESKRSDLEKGHEMKETEIKCASNLLEVVCITFSIRICFSQ